MIEQADIRSVLARLSKKWKDRQMRVTAVNLNIADHMYTDDVRACLAGTCSCPSVRKIEAPKPYPEKM